MHKTAYDRQDLLNLNYLYHKPSDESPAVIAQSLDEWTSLDEKIIQPSANNKLHSPSSTLQLAKREKIMIAAIALLVILLVLFIALFASKIGREKTGKLTSPFSNPSKESIIVAAGKLISTVQFLFSCRVSYSAVGFVKLN